MAQVRGRAGRQWLLYGLVGLVAGGVIVKLLAHTSSEPWIWGRYSLPYLSFLILCAVALGFGGVVFYRFGSRALYVLVTTMLVCGLALEGVGQVYASLRPGYDVLMLIPDRVVGWKQVPNLRYTWTGHHWYAADFSVPVTANSHGFRDMEREVAKPRGVVRIAVVGDSMVEAVQVPLEKAASHLLERKLNANAGAGGGEAVKYEVLNFGVSNYGIGQYLLVWEEYVSKFQPDYVFILVAGFIMKRTARKYEAGAYRGTEGRELWVRPTFHIDGGRLVREEARDFEEFVAVQKEVIQSEFGGERIRRRERQSMVVDFYRQLYGLGMSIQKRFDGQHGSEVIQAIGPTDVDEGTLAVNLRVMEELGLGVSESGGRLVIVNGSGRSNSEAIQRLCAERRFGYVPLNDLLSEATAKGIATRWAFDGHFNESGNEILADALHGWMAHSAVREGGVGRGEVSTRLPGVRERGQAESAPGR